MKTFRKILCPTDFSMASYEALKLAIGLADDSNCEICVVHVEPDARDLAPLVSYAPDARSEGDRRAEIVGNLCAVLDQRLPPQVRARPILRSGHAAEQIVLAAREEGADLIVLTTHGAGQSEGPGLGAVAEAVVSTAHCPVLTVNAWRGNDQTMLTDTIESAITSDLVDLDNIGRLRPDFVIVHTGNELYLDGD